ncbi:ribosomal protein S27a, putative [Trichomonas vaginalis G3]|uniref:Ribosomal protein S27a, putative n=1 Tax=Trichomonas vaginalis (strain ATCC PRA-98 / G3) TaxID=412133 RepID=A2EUI6_TRIV3|nr:structural constituent of ribosome [Trichomonas vaginalis G3]EAY03688.1 ribosomal protein S27a, putative [Trichomonas vaginalis G3]KAI5532094.1 structural constituent of ribosome [Trichomonas vaginalis G3]|eukprot:XP_001315911.1 ribosomal protein S27a [Trichomonas vaginalis G3]
MQVFVRSLSGKFLTLEVPEGLTLEELKAFTDLELAGAVFENAVLDEFEVDDGGKKKKRKKKNFVSKKRVPHQRKKEKLKILKLFKIGKDGSVEAQRKECPHCKGCFLAKHKDGRQYCGNCHYTVDKEGKQIKSN